MRPIHRSSVHPLARLVLLAWCALVLPATASTAASSADTKRAWEQVRAALRHGAYRDALQPLDQILEATPDDPWAQLYRSLCQLRLEASSPIASLTPEQLATLSQQLHDEARLQHQEEARQKSLERHIQKEQAHWDRELDALQRQAERDERLKRKQAQTQAIEQVRLQRRTAQTASRSTPTAPQPEAPSPAATEASPAPSGTPPHAETPSAPETPESQPPSVAEEAGSTVKLAPVVVSTGPEAAVTPSLAGRPRPPAGAVQIHARQMSVSPDRRVALAEGSVEVIFEDALMTCDRLTLFTDTKDAYAEGRVRVEQGDQVFRGEMVHYNFVTKKGRFLQGTLASPPWYEHGRSVEHIAEGVFLVTPGYITSCELEPPHFKFFGRRAIVFAGDKIARARNVALIVEQVPFLFLPWLAVADRRSPFFIIPGKRKPWGEFALMGYRYEWPERHRGTLRLDWRHAFGWGFGLDHQFDDPRFGKGLLKLYYNPDPNSARPLADLPKGADKNRYRLLWRHHWQPWPDTSVVTNIQKYSDEDFRRELLFREEFTEDDNPESFVSLVKNAPDYSLTGLFRKRLNRFDSITEALPELTLETRQVRIGETQAFSQTRFDVANLQSKTAHSDIDADVIRVDWFQKLSYALNLFRPILVTPNAGIQQTFYTKDIQGADRPDTDRNLFSGQVSMGADASLKLFRIFPVVTNVFGMDVNGLRHVLTPTVSYSYIHRPTVSNSLLNFPAASAPTNQVTFSVENKLQAKRHVPGASGPDSLQPVELGRAILSVPYTFRGVGNKQGGRLGDWAFDIETYPVPWLRVETDFAVPSHFPAGSRDARIQTWNLDLVMVGGRNRPEAKDAPTVQAPQPKGYEMGGRGGLTALLIPQGQWFLGLGHRYSQNDKTEDVLQFDWRLSEKWEISTFHRFTWKEVVSGVKRFNNMREYQYVLRRDLHDWIAELVYRVDREFGEELYLTLSLKAYPQMPIEMQTSYHEPKLGSQSSPFSPIRTITP